MWAHSKHCVTVCKTVVVVVVVVVMEEQKEEEGGGRKSSWSCPGLSHPGPNPLAIKDRREPSHPCNPPSPPPNSDCPLVAVGSSQADPSQVDLHGAGHFHPSNGHSSTGPGGACGWVADDTWVAFDTASNG